MRKQKPTYLNSRAFVPGRQYRGSQGKVVGWVEHKFEEGLCTSTDERDTSV